MISVSLFLSLFFLAQDAPRLSITGVVKDPTGAVVAGAHVILVSASTFAVRETRTNREGRFAFTGVPRGTYEVHVTSPGFADHQGSTIVGPSGAENLEIRLELRPLTEDVTVTASRSAADRVATIPQSINVVDEHEIEERAKAVLAQVAAEEPGVHVQRTSPTMSGIFVRGLTGNKVNFYMDGVRYSTAGARGGVNTFLNLIEPTALQSVEILRGPASAQYGSDAIGGSVQFLSRAPSFNPDGPALTGRWGTSGSSADASFGTSLTTSYATENVGVIASLAGRRVNTLRPGGGTDSRNAVTRFLGLSSDFVLDDGRLPDTAFTQYGGIFKLSWAPSRDSRLTFNYQRGQQDGGKRYDQLLGGDGNLVADLRNLMLDLFYARYDRTDASFFDSVTAIYSFNSQREERVNQGGNGNPRASINHEYERTNVNGFQGFAAKAIGSRHTLLVGGEFYHERIDAPSFGFNPVSNVSTVRRGRVPDEARYASGAVYAQDTIEVFPQKLRVLGSVRYSRASYESLASDSPLVDGAPLWPDDSLDLGDVTFRVGAVVTPQVGLNLTAAVSRGFRAPHVTDLGTLGLTGAGFEVAAPDVSGLGGTVGTTANASAVSTGLPVAQVGPEASFTYDFGARYRKGRFASDFSFFVNDIFGNIVKQTLILPQGAVGVRLGDQVVTSQTAGGAVFVPVSSNPVLVRANYDDARLYGFEHELGVKIAPAWSAQVVWTYVHAADKRTGLPPNIEGGTPAPEAWVKIRYVPVGRRYWFEPYLHAATRQDRLSTLDLDDRRTGAGRTSGSIGAFFANGATARGLVGAGSDGRIGTADDVLLPTNETVDQVRARVLGPGLQASSLYRSLDGYAVFGLRGGFTFRDKHEIFFDFENISDANYRGISWGIDAAGRGVSLRYSTRF